MRDAACPLSTRGGGAPTGSPKPTRRADAGLGFGQFRTNDALGGSHPAPRRDDLNPVERVRVRVRVRAGAPRDLAEDATLTVKVGTPSPSPSY